MPAWVIDAYNEYTKRLPKDYQLNLIELKLSNRSKNTQQCVEQESEQLLAAVPKNNHLIALDSTGKQFETKHLAAQLRDFHDNANDISLLIGGPDGLSEYCLAKAHDIWSLSKLTFPHPLVRVILAEQIYRATSLLAGHPYHR